MLKKFTWTIEKIKAGLERFHTEHGRYPTALEIDAYPHLPSSRQIQRRFGGLPTIRKELNLKGPEDFTRGEYSSKRSKIIGERAHSVEKLIYEHLVKRFGRPFVHREYFFTDDHRNRTDFYVYHSKGNFLVDVFYPKDAHNFTGCLNSKMRSYNRSMANPDPIIFLMMNKDIGEDQIKSILTNKKNQLKSNQSVMTFDEFTVFCKRMNPLEQQRVV